MDERMGNQEITRNLGKWAHEAATEVKAQRAEIFMLSDDEMKAVAALAAEESMKHYAGDIDCERFVKRMVKDAVAREHVEILYRKNRNLIYGMVWEYYKKGYGEFDDLDQIAALGFLSAEKTYDPNSGTKFSTYATVCMRNEILQHVRKSNSSGRSAIVVSLNSQMEGKDGAAMMGMENLAAGEWDDLHQSTLSTEDFVVSMESARGIMELISSRLSPKERDIFIVRVFKGQTQSQIAKKFGISQANVSKTLKSAAESLGHILEQEGYRHM